MLWKPWGIIHDVDVPIPHAKEKYGVEGEFIRIPWATARTEADCMHVLRIVAEMHLMAMSAAGLPYQMASGKQVHPKKTYQELLHEVRQRKYDGPRMVFGCDACDETWDAWVDDDGHLEDPRDAFCWTTGCTKRGTFARPVEG